MDPLIISIPVLVVDDDAQIRELLESTLRFAGWEVHAVPDAATALVRLTGQEFDVVVLDVMMPGLDGFETVRLLRGRGKTTPVLFLTARQEVEDRIQGLRLGADDYVTKPFEPRELVARVRTVLRRYGRQPGSSHALPPGSGDTGEIWHFAGWQLDATTLSLVPPEGGPVRLTGQEFQLLKALVVRRGRVLSREQILDIVSHRQWTPYDRSIDVLIAKLRRKLDDHAGRSKIIRTIRGVGYTFVPRVDVSEASEDVTHGK